MDPRRSDELGRHSSELTSSATDWIRSKDIMEPLFGKPEKQRGSLTVRSSYCTGYFDQQIHSLCEVRPLHCTSQYVKLNFRPLLNDVTLAESLELARVLKWPRYACIQFRLNLIPRTIAVCFLIISVFVTISNWYRVCGCRRGFI